MKTNDKAGVIIFPPLLYLAAISLSIFLSYLFPFPILKQPISLSIGVTLLLFAFFISQNAVKQLLKSKTSVNPSGATTAIVKTGIFQFSRNPMYLSFTLAFIAVSILLNSWYGLFLLMPLLIIVNKGIIEKEENYLTQKFGEEYLSYKKKVNRWLKFKK